MENSPFTSVSKLTAYVESIRCLLGHIRKISNKNLLAFFVLNLFSKISYLLAFILTIKYVASHKKIVSLLPSDLPEVSVPILIVVILISWVFSVKYFKVVAAKLDADLSFIVRKIAIEKERHIYEGDPLRLYSRIPAPSDVVIESVVARAGSLLSVLSVLPVLMIVYIFMLFDAPDFTLVLSLIVLLFVFFLPVLQKSHRNTLDDLKTSKNHFKKSLSVQSLNPFSGSESRMTQSIFLAENYKKKVIDSTVKKEASTFYTNLMVAVVFASLLFWYYFSSRTVGVEDVSRVVIFIVCVRLLFSNLNTVFSQLGRVNQGIEDVISFSFFINGESEKAGDYIKNGMYIEFSGYKPPVIDASVAEKAAERFGLTDGAIFVRWGSAAFVRPVGLDVDVSVILGRLMFIANSMESGDVELLDLHYVEAVLGQKIHATKGVNYVPVKAKQKRLARFILIVLRAVCTAKPLLLTSENLTNIPKELINFLFAASFFIPIYIATNQRGYNFTGLDEFQFRRFVRKISNKGSEF